MAATGVSVCLFVELHDVGKSNGVGSKIDPLSMVNNPEEEDKEEICDACEDVSSPFFML